MVWDDSWFDAAMRQADTAIMQHMGGKFECCLVSGETVHIAAIYDTRLSSVPGSQGNASPRQLDASYEHGVLTVLGRRCERRRFHGATINTPTGKKVVTDIFYPDRTTTVMVLGVPGGEKLPSGAGARFTR
ncbi:TPA: hypothetical protein ACGFB9_001066 [Escherichia coli]